MVALSEDAKFNILYDHYKDTFAQIKDHIKVRDRVFIYVLILTTIILFQVFAPSESSPLISEFITSKLELSKPLEITFIDTILLFILLVCVVRYFQQVVIIERLYKYIHILEKKINCYFDKNVITREGKSYLSNYPFFSHLLSWFYTIIFPILLLIVITAKIIKDLSYVRPSSILLGVNVVLYIFLVASIAANIIFIHFRKKTKGKK